MKKVIMAASAVLVAVLLGVGVGFALWGFGDTDTGMPTRDQVRRYMGEFAASQYEKMLEYNNRSEGLLRVGDRAPGLTLTGLDGTPQPISRYYQNKPLVLSFGSYT